MLNYIIARTRWIISAIIKLFSKSGDTTNGTSASRFRFRPRALRPRGTGRSSSRMLVRYSYLASARRVRVGSIVLKRFELNTKSGRRIVSRRFKVLKHGYLVAA